MASTVVGAATVQLGSSTTPFYGGCQLVAHPSNTGIIYVGYGTTVTANTNAATDGTPLSAGAGLWISPMQGKSPSGIYCIGSASGQTITFDAQ